MIHDEGSSTNRRSFLARIAAIGAGAFALGGLVPRIGSAALQDKKPALAVLKLAEHEELEEVGGHVLVKGTPKGDLLVIRSGKDKYSVLSNICPHKECKVKVKSAELIQCPCHKSAYSIEGKYQHGPSKKDLTDFPYTVKNGVLTIGDA